ncbi:Flp family type IVb pilin [Aquabacter spiritensis]|uniref:Pilus assembly protein Flp/PilA n=1 Tax=Aquabacter spiritensis TaxID=933073 RepID=A0A4R3M3X8_9HYPH|nr:Flp family type IVb pilin [Aquabacter spiritensis]TCT07506.1 hypothetical protein EDC64_10123 [Aquabacter spiritensis]
MTTVLSKIAAVLRSDRGALSVEYGLILTGIVGVGMAVIAGLTATETTLTGLFTGVNAEIEMPQ